MNGIALAQAIGSRYPQVPVLLTSGYSDVVQTAESQFAVLRKPFQLPALEKSIREALERGGGQDSGDRVLQFSRWRGATRRDATTSLAPASRVLWTRGGTFSPRLEEPRPIPHPYFGRL